MKKEGYVGCYRPVGFDPGIRWWRRFAWDMKRWYEMVGVVHKQRCVLAVMNSTMG